MSYCSAINATTCTHAAGACPACVPRCRACPGNGAGSRGQAEARKDWLKIAYLACILRSTEAIRQRVGTAAAGTEPCGETWRPSKQRAPPALHGTAPVAGLHQAARTRYERIPGYLPARGWGSSRRATSKYEQYRRRWQPGTRTPCVRHPRPVPRSSRSMTRCLARTVIASRRVVVWGAIGTVSRRSVSEDQRGRPVGPVRPAQAGGVPRAVRRWFGGSGVVDVFDVFDVFGFALFA